MNCFMPVDSSVTAAELARKIIRLLELKPNETFELAKTRDGTILVKKVTDSV